jgi:hypothetical protein
VQYGQHLRSEGFVELDEADVIEGNTGPIQGLP